MRLISEVVFYLMICLSLQIQKIFRTKDISLKASH